MVVSPKNSKINPTFWTLTRSSNPALFLPDGSAITYEQLCDEVDDFTRKIADDPGPIALLCDGSYRQYVAYLGALNAGCPVLLTSESQALETTNITAKYAYSPKDDDLRWLTDEDVEWHPDLAVLLSTSGSTGSAKWVRLSFANIAANANSIAEYLSLSKADCAPMALPFQYSYGMSVVNSHLAVGAAVALLDGSVVDDHFWRSFEAAGCTSFAGVPHSFELMERSQVPTDTLKKLRYMTQAGGRLGAQNVERWVTRGKDEGWDFFVMYGQTEAAPRMSYLPPELALETPSSIGVPVPGGEMWVENENGIVLPDGEAGELCYRGPNTMMGYAVGDSDLSDPQGTDTLKTGDIAKRLPSGAFEIVGRMSRFVKLFGLRISLDEVEKHLAEDGLEAVCVAKGEAMHIVLAGISPDQASAVSSNLASWLDVPATSFKVVPVDALPRQSSGKTDLRAVSALVEDMEASSTAATSVSENTVHGFFKSLLPTRKTTVFDVFCAHFSKDQVSDDASFVALGGDSLSYVAVSIELEGVLGHLPRDWANMTVKALQAEVADAKLITWMDTSTLMRALAIMLIVSGHLSFFEYGGGGAKTLFLIAGMSFAVFTIPQIVKDHTVKPIATLGIRIAFISLLYTLLNFVATGYGEWPAFLFIGSWISPHTEGSVWFIEVYLQMLLIFLLALSLPPVRSVIARIPFKATALTAFGLVLVAAVSDYLIDTEHLFRRLPHLLAWIFTAGVALGLARNTADKWIVTGIFCLGFWQFGGYGNPLAQGWAFFPIAALVLIWVPSLPVPRMMTGALRSVAGASLMIYLTHFQVASVSKAIFGDIPALSWLLAIIGGTIAWKVYERVEVTARAIVLKKIKAS